MVERTRAWAFETDWKTELRWRLLGLQEGERMSALTRIMLLATPPLIALSYVVTNQDAAQKRIAQRQVHARADREARMRATALYAASHDSGNAEKEEQQRASQLDGLGELQRKAFNDLSNLEARLAAHLKESRYTEHRIGENHLSKLNEEARRR